MGFIQDWFGFAGASRSPRARSDSSVESSDGTLPGALPPSRSAASAVTLDRALTLTSVYRSIGILATAVAQLTLGVQRQGRFIEPTGFMRQPDTEQPLAQQVKRIVIGLAGSGNAYLRLIRFPDSTIAGVRVLNPLGVTPRYTDLGRKVYDYVDPYQPRGQQTFTASEIKHLRLLEVPGHVEGLGPIQACRASLGGSIDLRDFAGNWFGESGIPSGILSSDLQLSPELTKQYKKVWHDNLAEKGGVAVLGAGLNYQPILIKPADAQWLESQQFSVTDVARLFGIPAAYLLAEVNGSSMTYQSLEMSDTQFVRYTLMQYLIEIETAFTELLPRGQVAKFRVDGLLRPDTKSRAQIHKLYLDAGVISKDEVRSELGLDPLPGGAGQIAKAAPAALPAAPADESADDKETADV